MIWMFCCAISYVLLFLLIHMRKKKRLGKPVLMTHSVMSRKEVISLWIRSALVVVVALIMQTERYVEDTRYLTLLLCAIAIYLGYLIFPFIHYTLFKKEIGIYHNGVITYNGIMEYAKMKEYMICENHNHSRNGQNMTVYCKSTIPITMLTHHFDIESKLVKEANRYFKKKHKQIKKTDKKKESGKL